MELTQEQLTEINRQLQRERGSKGGSSWWGKLTEEQRQERIKNMVKARRIKKDGQSA